MPAEPDATYPSREILLFYRQEIHFESELVGRRVNALLSSQSFLVIAYGSAMAASNDRWDSLFAAILPPALALLGLVMTLLAWPGIRAAQGVVQQWQAREDELVGRAPDLDPFTLLLNPSSRQDLDRRRREGTQFAARVPVVLMVTWCLFATLPLLLRLAAN